MVITPAQLTVFLLILGRIVGIFIQAPLLNSRSIPFLIKTTLAVWLAIIFWFTVPINPALPVTTGGLVTAFILEVLVGFLIGFLANVIFVAVQAAGEIMDLQMGLSVATALDPVFGSTISVIGKLTFSLSLVIFVSLNGHHLLFAALHQSFTTVPAGTTANIFNPAIQVQLMELGVNLWRTAIILAAPAVLLIFLSDFCFGIVSRVAPQVNVFMMGFQVKPSLGLVAILISIPFIIKYISNILAFMGEEMLRLIVALQ